MSGDFLWVSLVLAYRGSLVSTPVIPYIYPGAFNNFVSLCLLVGQNWIKEILGRVVSSMTTRMEIMFTIVKSALGYCWICSLVLWFKSGFLFVLLSVVWKNCSESEIGSSLPCTWLFNVSLIPVGLVWFSLWSETENTKNLLLFFNDLGGFGLIS